MAKILLVEDDNNLREIYEARLQAEGYEIVSAKDGEEALVVAKKERPDLIIADVMMPRVSGFEMLDILRNTPELKDVHVIMLTALGQAEDKTRADSLGADRYLVKSQVTLEDIVKAAADVLAGAPAGTPAMAAATADAAQSQAAAPTPAPATPAVEPPAVPVTPAPAAPQDSTTPTAPVAPSTPNVSIPVSTPPAAAPTPTATPVAPTEPSATDSQLVTNAVNDLVAGTAPQDTPAATPVQPLAPAAQMTPMTPPPTPVTPQSPLTMQPVLTPPVTPVSAAPPTVTPTSVPPPTPADDITLPATPPAGRKAISPLPAGSVPTPTDLNELVAKEGHNMNDDTNFGHAPGNVITPGGVPTSPGPQTPTDPNSISL